MSVPPIWAAVIAAIGSFALTSATFAANPNKPDPNGVPADNPDPEIELRAFKVADGFEVSLFAGDPQVLKPVQMNFDARGRLWVASSETYPQVKPGQTPNDKVIVLEDTDGDGRVDKSSVFADGLLLPTGIVPDATGGAFVANSVEVLHLTDAGDDGRARQRRVVLSGFGTEDTHHIIHTFRWGPDGRIYFSQAIYIHSHVETPRGTKHLLAAGTWRFQPDSLELDVATTGRVNPWGTAWDRWGQMFGTDGAGFGGIYDAIPGAGFEATYGATRVLPGLNPKSPKYAGLEVLSGRHLPDDVQGDLLTNDFRANRIVRFKLVEQGAGYESKQMPDFLTSTDKAFRPVDIKMGPDGAIYIADWYNPIINHGEVDFRDPRRDHTHGRIWRVTAKGRPLVERPKLVGAPVGELLDHFLDPEDYTRQQTKIVLRSRGADEVKPALAGWVAGLGGKLKGSALDHARVEALWAYECIDTPEPKLLAAVLKADDPHARGAAARTAAHWATKLERPADLLAPLVADDNPRVRLQGVRALAALGTPDVVPLAMRALDKPIDPMLDYALYKTAVDLQTVWLPAQTAGTLTWASPKHLNFALGAIKSPEALAAMIDDLKKNKTPPDARRDVYDLLASIGDDKAANMLVAQAADAKLDPAIRAAALSAVERMARLRHVTPGNGQAPALTALLDAKAEPVAVAAARAIGATKTQEARAALEKAFATPASPPALRSAAADAIASLGGSASQKFLEQQATAGADPAARAAAVAGLASLDPKAAAAHAAELLAKGGAADPTPLLAAFLRRQNGADALAAALTSANLPPDAAKLALRSLQGIGQDAPAVADALRKASGITGGARSLSADEMRQTVAEVQAKGDPARGEAVFRSKTAGCYQCHAIGGAGGPLAPDLRAIGASSPVDYLVDSLLDPNKAIKDGYASLVVATKDGDVVQGIKVREDERELVLRDNLRDEFAVALSEIKSRKDGGSLMPAGLADGLTRGEFLDLVRFLSELGKPGPYAVPDAPVVRRWQVLYPTPGSASSAGDAGWQTAYSTVSGTLPPDALFGANAPEAVVRCQIEVTEPGKVRLLLDSPKGVSIGVDDKPPTTVGESPEVVFDLAKGVRTLTFKVDRATHSNAGLRVEVVDVPGSTARARPVGGR